MSTPQPLTFESVLELIEKTMQGLDQRFQDTDKRLDKRFQDTDKRLDKRFQETDRKFQGLVAQVEKTQETVKETSETIGNLGNRFGRMYETLLGEGKLVDQFRELGIRVKSHSQNKRFGDEGTADSGEIDLFLEDGNVAILVEAKTTLSMKDVTKHIERIEKYRRFTDADSPGGKRFVGAVAGTVIPESVKNFAHENGLYVIIQSARAVEILPSPAGFVAKEW